MIEWLASKIGVLIAVGVLTSFSLGLFAWQHSVAVDAEGQMLADNIAEILDAVGRVEAATVLSVSFGKDPGQLSDRIGGKEYTLNITADCVMVASGRRIWTSGLANAVIPQNLSRWSYNLTEFDDLFVARHTGQHPSIGHFFVERAEIDVSGKRTYVTMVYWE